MNEVLKHLVDYPFDSDANIRKMRLDAELTVSEAARLAGVSKRTWERYENGSAKPNRLVVIIFMLALGELPKIKVFMF